LASAHALSSGPPIAANAFDAPSGDCTTALRRTSIRQARLANAKSCGDHFTALVFSMAFVISQIFGSYLPLATAFDGFAQLSGNLLKSSHIPANARIHYFAEVKSATKQTISGRSRSNSNRNKTSCFR